MRSQRIRWWWSVIWTSFSFLLFLPALSSPDQWRNPQEVIGDPALARFQQERKELNPGEKEDLQKYGYTGLEIMTYLKDNQDPGGFDYDFFRRIVQISARGLIQSEIALIRMKYSYRDYKALLTYDGIRPGEVKQKMGAFILFPPKEAGTTGVRHFYLRSKDFNNKYEERTLYPIDLRRPRRFTPSDPQDNWRGTILTNDDDGWREPWEENHRILGEDTLRRQPCWVIESRHLNPDYYLSKRVIWVEKTHFTDLHEEQFDRQGQLWKVIDKDWKQVMPGDYWAKSYDYWTDLSSGQSTVFEYFDWRFNQGFEEKEFAFSALIKGVKPWRESQRLVQSVKDLSELPPKPKIRWEFWKTRKDRPEAAGIEIKER